MKFMTKADKILIIVLIIASISSIYAVPALLSKPLEGKYVVVNLDSKIIYQIPLEEATESTFYEFDFEYGGEAYTGKLEMKDGRVKLHRLSDKISPLSIHTDMGWISESYQMIICLPIKLLVTIEEYKPEGDEFDFIAH